ncbi:hypothetical protein [Melioribacter sp. OK-6-Me]|uniref:hypothetical protein n=1 Tax=unclassified Melioribacter TaxID=2627329 RepID=UPI003ED87C3C
MRIKLNHIYRCKRCGARYVIMRGRGFRSYLPVELKDGSEIYDNRFDRYKHTSHLINCPGLQAQWEEVKSMIYAQEKEEEKRLAKESLR